MNPEIRDIYESLINGQIKQATNICFETSIDPRELAACYHGGIRLETLLYVAWAYGKQEERDWNHYQARKREGASS